MSRLIYYPKNYGSPEKENEILFETKNRLLLFSFSETKFNFAEMRNFDLRNKATARSNGRKRPAETLKTFRRFAIILGAMVFLAPAAIRAQLPPTAIPQKLWEASLRDVTGGAADPSWEAVHFSAADSARISKKLKRRRQLPDTLYVGHIRAASQKLDMMLSQSRGKSELFTFALYFTPESGKIIDVDVLEYRESYGGEIDYPVFRKQFRGKSKPSQVVFRRTIRNISGATISSRSLTLAVHDLLVLYAQYRQNLPKNTGDH